MDYITQKKFSFRGQPFVTLYGATVLLVEPEAESCAVYSRQLAGVHVNVITCGTLPEMLAQAIAEQPDAVIVNPTHDIATSIKFVSKIKQQFPSLPIITIGQTIRESHLDAIMSAGVSFHINRQLTHPRDLLLALEQVLTTN